MELKEKLRELHLKKRKSFRILLLMELLLIFAGVPGLFGKNQVYEYGRENMLIHFGSWNQET
ncbi:hypothetical protein IMSAG185_01532 [Lachnospiraceae bacterium]|nr:hypothetical protein IMSAG185_01532 [Lachnospiraceae bacterium]